ncbi:MAG: 3-oxoacyl-ACP reductase [Acidobacteria bacterium]|nr:MAG: 3-oxoacyl-ACP reductase [Acidobacteriota bacterium]
MDTQLDGRVAVVTGASRGIGRATARALLAEGARVAICARDPRTLDASAAHLRREHGEAVLACVADVAREGALEGVVHDAVERWGRLDVLVNNAGGPPPGSFDALGDADWRSAFELTLLSVVRGVRAALPHLRASDAGRVINVLSTSVKEPLPGMLLSNSLRSGVAGLAKTLSRELAPHGITVNNVCPAHILTGRLREVAAHRAAQGEASDARGALSAVPLRRFGNPAEVADLVAFLASKRAGYITGATIPVDGGSTASLT